MKNKKGRPKNRRQYIINNITIMAEDFTDALQIYRLRFKYNL